MARIRTIKPEFFTSDDVCSLTPLARLLYIGLWCEADREGRLVWAPTTLKRRYLPDDACKIDDVCGELVERGMVTLYGDGLAFIPSFSRHQMVNPRESASKLPRPDGSDQDLTRQILVPTPSGEGKGKEGEGKEDIDRAFALYGEAAQRKNWVMPRGLNANRKRKLIARLAEHGIDGWIQMLAIAEASEFLCTQWPMKFDWVLEPANFTKVIEGNYRNRSGAAPQAKQSFAQQAEASRLAVAGGEDDVVWRARLRLYTPGARMWRENHWGDRPESGKSRVPAHILAEWQSKQGGQP